MPDFPIYAPALRVVQSIGVYYTTVLPADLLLTVCFSDRLRVTRLSSRGYKVDGTQRRIAEDRLRSIAAYINRSDSAFPNSLILAANFREEDGMLESDDRARWTIKESQDRERPTLVIPTRRKLAAVIDGQHRLYGFERADAGRKGTQLICSVFIDLPKPFQAQLFATINSTQRPVDKSLTYELFGYNIEEEPESRWSPDKVAVFLARKLNVDDASPLRGRIMVAPENDHSLQFAGESDWKVSMATVVEGILRLISSNPKQDSNELLTPSPKDRKALETSIRKDSSVFRSLYLEGNDKVIYTSVINFLQAANRIFWARATKTSFIRKTVGIQALFDIHGKLCKKALELRDISIGFFARHLEEARDIDFSDPEFRNASGSGRTYIRKAIESRVGI